MTNQEKMTKIYELTGIEPRMCSGKSSGGDLVISDYYNVYDEYRIDLPNPYYPAEQLWEELSKVKYKKDLYPEMRDEDNPPNYEDFYFKGGVFVYYEMYEGEFEDEDQPVWGNRDLMSHLIDETLWCISEGYIKKRGEE